MKEPMMTEAAREQAEFDWFVGIDWGTAAHAVDVSDAAGTPVGARTVEHTSVGLQELVDWLRAVSGGNLERVAVAIEVPRGAVVDLLLERGATVFALNPKQLDRFRDRFSVAGAKDDRLDAHVLGSALRTDRARFQRLAMDEPLVIRVRELARAEEVLQQEFMALTNRLRDLVHRIAPEYLTLSANADDPWFWTLLEQTATPTGRRVRRAKIQSVLRRYRIRRVSVDEVLRVVRTPPLTVAPGTVDAVTAHIQLLLPRVRLVAEQRRACARELAAALEQLATTQASSPSRPGSSEPTDTGTRPSGSAAPSAPSDPGDIAILRSAPGVGLMVTATFLADAHRLLRLRDYAGLRALSGVAPVRRQTGKNKRGTVSMRYACNRRVRNASYHWARVSTRLDDAARRYYAALRARGHSHGRALRSVADRWLRILIAMLKTRTLYDATRFPDSPDATPSTDGAVQLAPAS
jgi:transposase